MKKTKPKNMKVTKWSPIITLLFILTTWAMPQGAWAANGLETVMIEGKTFYVLRNNDDWTQFSTIIQKAEGKEDMNAIMDGDFTISSMIGQNSDSPFSGIFDGNGHTLNVDIKEGDSNYAAPFSQVKNATFKNLHVTGTVNGGQHSAGLIGSSDGTNYINNCWVSVTVNCTNNHLGGFLGHGHTAKHIVDNCLFDGTLNSAKGGSDSYGGSFVGWEEGGTSNVVTHCLENGTYTNIRNSGMNYNKSKCWSGGSTNWSYHPWNEVNGNVVGTMSIDNLVAKLGSSNWQVVNGKAIPKTEIYPKSEDVSLETYDALPGTEDGEEGMMKLPVTSDQPIKYLDATYTDENGNKVQLPRITLEKDSYVGFLELPATQKVTNLTITAKLLVGSKTTTVAKVSMIHTPKFLYAEVDSVGGVKLHWKVLDLDFEDLLEGDIFQVQRSLTGKVEDFEDLESSLVYDSETEDYLFRDSLLISDLTAEQIDKDLGIPLVRYRVFRTTTQEMWESDKNPTIAYVQPQFATLALLQPTNATAAWSDFEERKAKAKWDWVKNDASHNYVWDNRAEMKIKVKMFNRAGNLVDSLVTTLTDEQYTKREVELTLNRSCVTYEIQLIVDGSKSPIGKGEGEIFTLVTNRDEYVTYRNSYNSNQLTSRQNVILAANIVSPTNSAMLGESASHPFTHNFNGNGYTLTYENVWAGSWRGIIQHAADGAVVTNLNSSGRFFHDCKYGASLVAHVKQGNVFIENCYSNMTIQPINNKDGNFNYLTGGLVGLVGTPDEGKTASLRITNSQFIGDFSGGGKWSGIVGWKADGSFAIVSNSYYNGYHSNASDGNATIMFSNSKNPYWSIIDGCSYKNALGSVQGKQSATPPVNPCWKDNHPKMEQKSFSIPVSGSVTQVTLPSDKFYFENLGHIDKKSLETTTLQSSVLLKWKLQGEDAVDYFEVWRREKGSKDSICIATQLIDFQYEDKKVSAIRDYEYKVLGVNDCEGLHSDATDWVPGNCVQTGLVEGYVRFADGTGVPDVTVTAVPDGETTETTGGHAVTDESGYYRIEGLPYWNTITGAYTITTNATSDETRSVEFDGNSNQTKDKNFTVTNSVKFTGYVMYDGTSIPVQNVGFLVDGKEVKNASGKVVTDFEGKFAFRMLPGKKQTIQAVKDGHTFWQDGFYMANNSKEVVLNTDKADVYFYDNTRVTLIGRVVGGKDQGDLPLGNSLSKNNLGNDLKMVFVLEGDKTSQLVFDVTDRSKKTHDTIYVHQAHDKKFNYHTRVHTTQYRVEVTPDIHTGEYHVELPPVKWKIQQITAQGYATLFQDGQTGDVIDLTDSITLHTDHLEGSWVNANNDPVTSVDVKYHAKYSRIYRSPILLERKQVGFESFDYFGDRIYTAQSLAGDKVKVPLAYQSLKAEYLKDKEHWVGKDSLEVIYTFGYPVFNTERSYPIIISAVERYYYNNNMKSDTVDVVKLDGGSVTIRNGLISGTNKETHPLDENGEYTYILKAALRPYLMTGKDALSTVTFTLERDSVTTEGEPLKAYTLSQYAKPGAKDYMSVSAPVLVDVLRDPPGGGSSAKLSKGSTLKLNYQMDMSWTAGATIGVASGASLKSYTGIGTLFSHMGLINSGDSKYNTSISLIFSGSGQRAFSYTMTTNEDISTDAGNTMVGADADIYMGFVNNIYLRPSIALRAIPDSTFRHKTGELLSGRMVEIAQGKGDDGGTYHLVRDEIVGMGQTITSNFVHSQQYILNQLIPGLAEECMSKLYVGTREEAQTLANTTGKRVYLSLRDKDDPLFGVLNTDSLTDEYIYNSTCHEYEGKQKLNYIIVVPSSDNDSIHTDEIYDYGLLIQSWCALIQQNEQQKLEATDLVNHYDVDGGATISYSEDFASDYSNSNTYKNPVSDFTNNFFERDDVNDTSGNYGKYIASGVAGILGPIAAKLITPILKMKPTVRGTGVKDNAGELVPHVPLTMLEFKFGGHTLYFSLTPVVSFDVTPKQTIATKYNRKESFTIKMDKKSHMAIDVYRVKTIDTTEDSTVLAQRKNDRDVFVETNFERNVDYVHYFINKGVGKYDKGDFVYPKSFVYRTRGGATVRPWEPERTTKFYRVGTVLDERTKKIENPVIKMDRQSISGVPADEPARFKLYMTNESEQPEAISGTLMFYTLYLDNQSNPKGAKLTIDGMPMSADGMTVKLVPGEVTEKTLEVWAGEDFDYDDLTIGLLSQGDVNIRQEVSFSVHFLRQAGAIAISSPGEKWIMNTDAPYDSIRGWYMPVIINGFNKNQRNFDHIEFQYKETTRGDDYWTNLCGYYKDKALYDAASGTKEMIPENGYIVTRFYGDGKEMEKGYDLRAVLFCRNGNSFITSSSAVLTGVKDTRRPQLFGTIEPKNGILGPGDNIIFNFSEDIEYNYLSGITNFEVVGEVNETAIQEEPSLDFRGKGYATSQARRNFTNKNVSIDVMVKPDKTGEDMPIFSHGTDGHNLQLWILANGKLKAVVDDQTLMSDAAIDCDYFNEVVMVLDNSAKKLYLYNDSLIGSMDNVTYSGYGTLIFGSTNQGDISKRSYYKGRMLEGRVWNRALNKTLIDTYGKKQLTGYEMGLTDYYQMNEGEGNTCVDLATGGADLTLTGAAWALPRGMSLYLDWAEDRDVKGLQLQTDFISRTSEQDYTLMFWFRTDPDGRGALLSNGSGKVTDVNAADRFFIGFEGETLKYRSNGEEYKLGDNYSDDAWHHYAMTVNRSRQVANIYVDNVLKASFMTDKLGGMTGNNFFLGNMVWQEAGPNPEQKHYQNALTGHIDELCLFKQALPTTLIKRYSRKSPRGNETGLITYMGFNRQERTKQNELELFPYALNQVITIDEDGVEHVSKDSVFVNPLHEIISHIDKGMGAPVQPYQELKNLNFSFVGKDNQLLVNIDELDKKVNKRTVYVTLTDIPDKNGNYMASPATEAFYVNRNPLIWDRTEYTEIYPTDFEGSLCLYFSNNSGSSHTYTIENVPRWLTYDKISDIIEPQQESYVVFKVSKDLNPGTYDQILYLTDENGLSEPLKLVVSIEGTEPEWVVDQNLKRYSMNIVAQVSIGDAIVTDSRDIIAAFDNNGQCMGTANVEYNGSTGLSMVYLTVYNSTNEPTDLNFRLWHYDTGKTMLLTTPKQIVFGDQTHEGTVKEPVKMTASDLYLQHLDLAAGWNWISFNVKNDSFNNVSTLLNMFEWEDGDIVTEDSQDLTLVYKDGQWMSNSEMDISKVSLSPAFSYRVKTKYDISIDLFGTSLKEPIDRLISVKQGWNSIGYTPLVNLPVATALSEYWSFAKDGDIIKSQDAFAQFYEGSDGTTAWMGSLKYMKPGDGYMLYRQKEGEVKFRYPYFDQGATFIDTSSRTPRRNAAHRSTMTIVAEAVGVEVQEGDRLVAYANGEMVGEAELTPLTADRSPLFFLSIVGEQQVSISFTIEREGDIIATTGEMMDYEPDAISGSLRLPTKIDFVKAEQLPNEGWWSLQGFKLNDRPTQRGVYIYNGKKQIIK